MGISQQDSGNDPPLKTVPERKDEAHKTSKNKTRKDQEQFQEKLFSHLDALFNYSRYLNLSKQESEDLVRDTYLQAYDEFRRENPKNELKARLFTILQELYSTSYLSCQETSMTSRVRERQLYEQLLEESPLGTKEGVDKDFFSSLSSKEISKVLDDLIERYLSCVILADVEDFSYQEISDILDLPLMTVTSRLHSGREIIKRKLISRFPPEGRFPNE